MGYETQKRFIDMLAYERHKSSFMNALSLQNLLSRVMSAMSARDPTSRKVAIEDLVLTAKEEAAGITRRWQLREKFEQGGDPMDEFRGIAGGDAVVKKVEGIDGLETLMSSLGLEDKLPDAANWCEVNGAESVRDIHEANCAEQLAKDLGLPLVKANKLIKAIKELGTAGAHLDISAAEQAIKHESEI